MDFHDKFGLAPINVQKIDLNIFPAVRNISIIKATINPGDILYIPSHWWHVVLSHDAEPGIVDIHIHLVSKPIILGKEHIPNIAVTQEWW